MAEITWKGGRGDWYDPGRWTSSAGAGPAVPLPGDDVAVPSGSVALVGAEARDAGEFDDQEVSLGSPAGEPAPRLDLADAVSGIYFDVAVPSGTRARMASRGTSGFDGSLDVRGRLDLGATAPGGGRPADLVFTSDALLTVYGSGTLTIHGAAEIETPSGQSAVRRGGTLAVDGSLSVVGGALAVETGATLEGGGTVRLGPGGLLDVRGTAAAGATIAFDGPGAALDVGDTDGFQATVEDFSAGDAIDLAGVAGDSAAFDPATGAIDVRSGGADGTLVAAIAAAAPAAGPLEAVSDGRGGTRIEVAGSRPALAYDIDTGDHALGADAVRASMTTGDGAPVDGSGVRIGIVSDSFDATGTADAAAAAGYLPSDAATGTAAVAVLKDDPGGSDEGQAMAELIHQIAPGAAIVFCASGDGVASAAEAVTALRQAGCDIVTDDVGFPNEPIFQVTDRLDDAIQAAVDDGVSYFTAASNEGNAFYQGPFDPVAARLMGMGGQTVTANRFGDGTPYQTITATGGETLAVDIQWDAPYPGSGAGTPDSLAADLYDARGDLVATSHQLELGGKAIPEIELDVRPPAADETDYRLAVYQPDGTPAVGQFYYTLDGTVDGATQPGGYVDDPAAGTGAGTTYGHDLVPGADTVGAADWSNTPAYGSPYFAEGFSSGGPGELLFGRAGERLPEPVDDRKVDFLAPDGTDTSTPGFRPFLGTSAAAPDAAAVAALMLQANPDLSPAEVTHLLEASAVDEGLPPARQGAGLIQAPAAVLDAERLASPTLGLSAPTVTVTAGSGRARVGLSGPSDAFGQAVDVSVGGRVLSAKAVDRDGTWSAGLTLPARRRDAEVAASVEGTGGSSAEAAFTVGLSYRSAGASGAGTFVFDPADDQADVIRGLSLDGPPSTIAVSRSDFASIAAVLADCRTVGGDATIADPVSGATLTIQGVTKADLIRHAQDLKLV